MYAHVFYTFIIEFRIFSTIVPQNNFIVTDRCVPEKQRSFGVSIQSIIVRCLGSIPGPILFGTVIDETCLFWKTSCTSDTGACYAYDNANLSTYFLLLSLGCKVVVDVMFSVSLCIYKPPPSKDDLMISTTVGGINGTVDSSKTTTNGASVSSSDVSPTVLNSKTTPDSGPNGSSNHAYNESAVP